jgi:hypothetical protein
VLLRELGVEAKELIDGKQDGSIEDVNGQDEGAS